MASFRVRLLKPTVCVYVCVCVCVRVSDGNGSADRQSTDNFARRNAKALKRPFVSGSSFCNSLAWERFRFSSCSGMYCIAFHSIILHCIAFHYIALYCIALRDSVTFKNRRTDASPGLNHRYVVPPALFTPGAYHTGTDIQSNRTG